ncbi:MAG: glycosyltransferase family 2 protein, partial [Luteimonas sp.]|nr:glycosyltransferase family 2 protein [Luteimonas sp.]
DVVQRHASADPRLHFIGNPDNPGFGAACNDGARDSDAEWLVFVNPDCLVEPDALARLLAHAEALGRDALLGADLVDEHGVRDGAARRRDPDFLAMLVQPSTRDLSMVPDDAQPLQPVDAVSGAVMLMPRRLFRALGGFDTAYRLHAEDLDLCRRARAAGALVAVANDVRIVHLRGVSSRSRPLFVEWHKHRGLARYFRKFEAPRRGLPSRLGVYAAIWLRFPLAALRAISRR